ncbi:MAG: hypothetical protein HRT45_11960 [Bdellovibrionales bacterium]|nr:hypothetical protein [Bdellovibrionales bacterium]
MKILSQIAAAAVVGTMMLMSEAHATQSLDYTIHQHYISTRAMGMGNAFTAVADDYSAVFYNPAALARRKDGNLHMMVRAAVEADYMGLINDIEGVDQSLSDDDKLAEYIDILDSNLGEHYHLRAPTLGAIWARPGWGVAFIPADLSTDIGIGQTIGPRLNVNAYLDTTLAYSYARDTAWLPKNHRLSVGATMKAIHRVHVGQAIGAADLVSDTEVFDTSDANEGLTVDVDLGFMYNPPIPETGPLSVMQYFKPTFAFVIRNVIDHGFQWNFNFIDDGSGQPPDLQRRFDFGSKFEVPDIWVFDPKVAIDIRDVGHSNWSFQKGLHIGAELYWTMYSWWKGHWAVGLNQGYLTAGVGARLAWFQFDFATYGEEVGVDAAPKESRRYMLELSLDF